MKQSIMAGLATLGLLSIVAFADSTQTKSAVDAKQLVLTNKCQSCHSISLHGIEKKAGDDEDAAKMKQKPPDLSSVGLTRTREWVISYLQKKEDIKGVKHMKKFRGTDADLAQIADWLVTLKCDTTKAAPKK